MPEAPAARPVLDRERLASFTAGDAALERELVELYVITAQGYVAALRSALDDPRAWSRAAHALKGASANLGATAVAALALDAERHGPSRMGLDALAAGVAAVREAAR